jgi:integrase
MAQTNTSAGGGFASGNADQAGNLPFVLPQRTGSIPVRDVIDLYMRCYSGKDSTRQQRLSWWTQRVGGIALQDLGDDEVHGALEALATQRARYFAGTDADGKPIHKAKRKPLAPATLNRYCASLAAVCTWAIQRRIAPRGWVHPCRSISRRTENNARVRFLTSEERERLLLACRGARWPRLYALVLMALTTGARKGELVSLTWADVILDRGVATLHNSKNGDGRALPLVAAVVEELQRFKGADSERVFASSRRSNRPYTFESLWTNALRTAGIKNFRFHDLRHSCASMLAASGASLLEIADVLGHRQMQMAKRYAHLTTGHKAALVTRVLGAIK